jgi:hypothetical protein
MGGIVKSLFGSKGSKQSSGNKFADQINTSFSPWVSQGTAGMGQAASILGLNGSQAGGEALDNWWNSSGGQFLMDQGMDQIAGNRAAGGLLRSGGTMKAMEDYRSGLASTKLNEYMGNIFNLNQQALGAGGLIANAGQYSTGKGGGSSGLGSAIGAGLALFSDRRLKTDIERVGELPDGMGVYEWRYVWGGDRQRGVMADEVERLRPWALGPEVGGFKTVRYDLLEAA